MLNRRIRYGKLLAGYGPPLPPPPPAGRKARSLEFLKADGDYVDLGNHASIMGLEQDDMTVDAIWQCPAFSSLTNSTYYMIASQGRRTGLPAPGWCLFITTSIVPSFLCQFQIAGKGFSANCDLSQLTEGKWYYIRAGYDRSVPTRYLQIHGGNPMTDSSAHNPGSESENAALGQQAGGSYRLTGRLAYVHIWNSWQGQFDKNNPPTQAWPVDANTVARYVFKKKAFLQDDVGNNHGTIVGAEWSKEVPSWWSIPA